jgi:hypothetical protein
VEPVAVRRLLVPSTAGVAFDDEYTRLRWEVSAKLLMRYLGYTIALAAVFCALAVWAGVLHDHHVLALAVLVSFALACYVVMVIRVALARQAGWRLYSGKP